MCYSKLYYVGYRGPIKSLKRKLGKIMWLLDANLVLTLSHDNSNLQNLPDEYKKFTYFSRGQINLYWHNRKKRKWIPIDPCLAIMELTRQEQREDFELFKKEFDNFFMKIYKINNYDPDWLHSIYNAIMDAIIFTHPTITQIVMKTYSLISPEDKLVDNDVAIRCDSFFKWILENKNNLAIVGGPLLYVCIYAIAGNPNAKKTIKYKSARTEEKCEIVAKNVAWDFLYWAQMLFSYDENRYDDTVLCTGDRDLYKLIANGCNQYKLKRLSGTKLEKNLIEKFKLFSMELVG